MTNEERVAEELRKTGWLTSDEIDMYVAKFKECGLIAPDPAPRYYAVDRNVWGEDSEAPVLEFFAATAAERATVLAALSALPEEGEKP